MADLRQVADDLLRRAGMAAAHVDTAALSGAVPGLVLGERQSIRAACDELQAMFQFDVVTTGGVLTFRPRGQAAVLALVTEDLLADADGVVVTLRRTPDAELPEELNLVHLDPAADYQPSVQTALRQSAPPTLRKTLRTGMVLSADRAKQQADTLLAAVWAERVTVQFRVLPQYLALEPGDVVTLTHGGRVWTLRLLTTLFRDGVLEIEAVTTTASAYVQESRGAGGVSDRQVRAAGTTTLLLLDLPLSEGGEDAAACFIAVGKVRGDTSWQYATLYQALDGEDFAPRQVLTLEAVTGTAQTVLPASGPVAFWDDASRVTVFLADGVLYGATDSAVLNGSNTALIGDEIIQFATATLIAPATYELSRLLRGRRGTEWAMGSHAAGERFVLLGPEVLRLPVTLDTLGIAQTFKAVSSGALVEDAPAVSFTPRGISLKPFAPVHVRGSRDASGNLAVSWVRRTRTGGGWTDGSDVPLAEESERYEIEILNGGTVVRTLTSVTSAVSYSAAEQSTDFGAPQSSVSVRIYQLSAVVGRGFAAAAAV